MNMRLLIFVLIIILSACKQTPSTEHKQEEIAVRDTVIHLVEALDAQPQEFNVSEIADSITYIPLETKPNCLLGNGSNFCFTQEGIYPTRRFKFDWNGKFVKQYGRVGQGKGEDPNAFALLLKSKDYYYTVGNRIIEYDENGVFTNKETNRFFLKSREDSSLVYNLFVDADMTSIDDYIIFYDNPDSLFWINVKDFKVDRVIRVVEPGDIKSIGVDGPPTQCYFSSYNKKKLFYNFYNDTIYTVNKDGLSPEWVVDLGDRKLPNEITLYKLGPLSRAALKGNIESSELIAKTDGKIRIYNVYESDLFLMFYYSETRYFCEVRKKDPPVGRYIIYNKATKKLINGKIIDDINGGGTLHSFYEGVIDNKLITAMWPYELKEYVEKYRDQKKLSPKLIKMVDGLGDEDNPVLIVIHLKKDKSI